jgi:hypothetical protein
LSAPSLNLLWQKKEKNKRIDLHGEALRCRRDSHAGDTRKVLNSAVTAVMPETLHAVTAYPWRCLVSNNKVLETVTGLPVIPCNRALSDGPQPGAYIPERVSQ